MRRPWVVMVLPLLLAGCTDYLGPDRGDPAQYAFSSPVHFGCGGWAPSQPTGPLGLFDIYFGAGHGDRDGDRGPEGRHIRAVVAAGGTIVHRFNVTKVRVIAPVATVTKVGGTVRGVTDPDDLRVNVFVGFKDQVDPAVVTKYGGYVEQVYQSFPFVAAVVHDRMIPRLRGDSRISIVEGSEGLVCLAAM